MVRFHLRRLFLLLLLASAFQFALPGSRILGLDETSGSRYAADAVAPNSDQRAQDPDPELATGDSLANCRYGAAPVYDDKAKQAAAIPRLGAGWYMTFSAYPLSKEPANGADFVHMLKVQQNKDGFTYLPGYDIRPALDDDLAQYLKDNPGEKWIVGNEVDRGPNPDETDPTNRGQGDTHPEVYAAAYHDVYHFIKQYDPTAQVAISGLVEVTPGRLQYLDMVWNTYMDEYGLPMPVDIWTLHIYVLPEVEPDGITPNGIANVALGTDPALGKRSSGGVPPCDSPDVYCFAEHDDLSIFAEQLLAMREWMKAHGQKEKPLLLTEFSILLPFEDDGQTCFLQDEFGNCFTPQRVSEFMNSAMDYLNGAADPSLGYSLDGDRLVQQWMWYSIYNTAGGSASNLLQADLESLTQMGETFAGYVAAETTYSALVAFDTGIVAGIAGEDGTAAVNIPASFRNRGNRQIDQSFQVTFYEDAALSQAIGSVNVLVPIPGCAGAPHEVSLEWSDLAPGVHNYWYKLDSGDDLEENFAGNGDKIGSGKVVVISEGNWMPAVWK